MALVLPTVLYPLTLPALLDYLAETQSPSSSPTTLVVCSDQTTFLDDLAHSLKHHHHQGTLQPSSRQQLLAPTLHNLSAARHVKLAFCASVQALLAYLTAYHRPGYLHADESERRDRLVLVNPLALHRPTPSFSAQGLSRTFAAAVETALRTGAMLHLVECEGRRHSHGDESGEDTAMLHLVECEGRPHSHGDESGEDTAMLDADGEHRATTEDQPPWDQEVSILNVSARRFGSGPGERAWAGRTVKAKSIAARWFRFQHLAGRTNEGPG